MLSFSGVCGVKQICGQHRQINICSLMCSGTLKPGLERLKGCGDGTEGSRAKTKRAELEQPNPPVF